MTYSLVEVAIDRAGRRATITLSGPDADAPVDMDAVQAQGCDGYMLRLARELDDAILHLRLNEREVGLLAFRSQGDPEKLIAHEKLLIDNADQLAGERNPEVLETGAEAGRSDLALDGGDGRTR